MLTIEHANEIHLHIAAEKVPEIVHSLSLERAPYARSAAVQTPARYELGQPSTLPDGTAGGLYGGTMPARDGKPGWHLFVLMPARDKLVTFGPYDHDVAGAANHWDGLANTQALLASGKDHPAAKWASEQCEGSYLPAHAELCQLWINVPHLFEKSGWYWSSTQHSPIHRLGAGLRDRRQLHRQQGRRAPRRRRPQIGPLTLRSF